MEKKDGMRRKDLEMALQKVRSFDSPNPSLEQY
jgi:predicted RNA methylase